MTPLEQMFKNLAAQEEFDPDELLGLLDNPAFLTLLRVLKSSKEDRMEQLTRYRLLSQEQIIGATLLQGTIAGIDVLPDLLVQLSNRKAEEALQPQSANEGEME